MSRVLDAFESDDVVKGYLPIATKMKANNVASVTKSAEKLGYPIVLKAISKKLIHKSDSGAVKIAQNKEELLAAYRNMNTMARRKGIKIESFMVQEFINGKQLIFGIKKDPTFGHAIMLGFGGIYAEAFKDVTFRLCPITLQDADTMIQDLQSKNILCGMRGEKPVNLNLLKKVLVKLSTLPQKHNVEELDINPFIINHITGKSVDARIVLTGKTPHKRSIIRKKQPLKKRKPKKGLSLLASILNIEEEF